MNRFSQIVVWCCLMLTMGTAAQADQPSRRFWTMAGSEPTAHAVDLDLGNRRDFFQTDASSWVQRFPDGFLVIFKIAGSDNVDSITGKIVGKIIKSTISNLEYLIPDEIKTDSVLFYRLSDHGSFLPASRIFTMRPDDTSSSRLYIEVFADLRKVKDTVYATIPLRIDETDDTDAHNNGYRYRFDASTDSLHRQIGIVNNRIYVAQFYAGDVETQGAINICNSDFLGLPYPCGCHLAPIYVEADLDFLPAIVQNGRTWTISASDPHLNLRLLSGSDTHCSVLNLNFANKIRDALDRQSLKDRVIAAIKGSSHAIPTDGAWTSIQRPFFRKIGQQTLCVYLHPSAIWAGNLRGNFDAATAEVSVLVAPQIVFGGKCGDVTPKPLKTFDGTQTGAESHAVSDIRIPYSQVRRTILESRSVKNANIDDLVIESHQAYMTLKFHKRDGQFLILNAVPIIPIPIEEGHVSFELVFGDVPGEPSGNDKSAFNGSYSTDITEEINRIRDVFNGVFDIGSFKLNIVGNTMQGILLTCESDGLHGYLDLSFIARATYAE